MQVEQVPASEWQNWVRRNDAVIVDVREPHEWETGSLPGSKLISLADLPGALDDLDPTRPVLAVCRSGNRSQQAAIFLSLSGFTAAANLAGGLKALGMAD
jgi:rhodanese-related sulfurtransferase